jgi:hypothetical protein
MCMCSPTLFLLLCKRYYEEIGSNFTTKTTEKSSFFISYKEGGNSLVIWHVRGWGQTLVKSTIASILRVGYKVTIHVLKFWAIICFIHSLYLFILDVFFLTFLFPTLTYTTFTLKILRVNLPLKLERAP